MNNITNYSIIRISKEGIILVQKNKNTFIWFNECAKNYATENGIKSSKCVATRDITALTFTFYTQPKTKIVFKKFSLKNLIKGKTAVRQFLDLEKKIFQAGYTSYDLS